MDSNCATIVTAHDEYRNLDLEKLKRLMNTHIIVDGRNVFDKKTCLKKDLIYKGVGR